MPKEQGKMVSNKQIRCKEQRRQETHLERICVCEREGEGVWQDKKCVWGCDKIRNQHIYWKVVEMKNDGAETENEKENDRNFLPEKFIISVWTEVVKIKGNILKWTIFCKKDFCMTKPKKVNEQSKKFQETLQINQTYASDLINLYINFHW